ncbi:hypothetical protein CHARACLAT_024915 [Characodon lateralis]|uniref:Uncharacterized protein n=1 Tax=Characodon lateralis TaxID=208331 RepID=A0ABU7EGP6_9TELE|nr:hypothetical protein [Characodon lateralis]
MVCVEETNSGCGMIYSLLSTSVPDLLSWPCVVLLILTLKTVAVAHNGDHCVLPLLRITFGDIDGLLLQTLHLLLPFTHKRVVTHRHTSSPHCSFSYSTYYCITLNF